jgi:hypothetical protein
MLRWVERLGRALARAPARTAPIHRAAFSLRGLRVEEAPPGGAALGADAELALTRALRERLAARFFIQPCDVHARVADIERRWPGWRRALVTQVRDQLDHGVPLYAGRGPALRQAFDASRIARGPGDDDMPRWRPHRFAFAPAVALAVALGDVAADEFDAVLAAWMDEAASGRNRFCHGSNLVVLQRIVALCWAWMLLAARAHADAPHALALERRVLQILHEDVRVVLPRLGDSVPNNHLLADRFVHAFVELALPDLLPQRAPGAPQAFVAELERQTFDDGGSFEHATHYHEFACEMAVSIALLARRAGAPPLARLDTRLRAMLQWQCALGEPRGAALPLGNAVEDALHPLDLGQPQCGGALRELLRALFDARVPPAAADDASVVRAVWLLDGRLAPPTPADPSAVPAAFPDAGVYVLADPDPAVDARLTFRTGPAPGRALCAGHAHADLLSVCVDVRGRAVLVDPGTYTYRLGDRLGDGGPSWRAYFAGAQAHNGPWVQGEDPYGALTGNFRAYDSAVRVPAQAWFGAAESAVEALVQGGGAYDGMRRVCLHARGSYWLIVDDLPAPDARTPMRGVSLQWAAGLAVRADGVGWCADLGDGTPAVRVRSSAALCEPRLLQGCTAPIAGWVSPHYGRRLPAPQLRWQLPPAAVVSALVIAVGPQAVGVPQCTAQADGSCRVDVPVDGQVDRWLLRRAAGAAPPLAARVTRTRLTRRDPH